MLLQNIVLHTECSVLSNGRTAASSDMTGNLNLRIQSSLTVRDRHDSEWD